jgi:hypothetical protein
MKKIKSNIVFPSAAYVLNKKQVRFYKTVEDRIPELGDLVFGEVVQVGEHSSLENKSARIHYIHNGTKSIFVFANRYAPDYYEAVIPTESSEIVDLVARSGIVGQVKTKNNIRKDPTQIKILGYVCDESGQILNTKNYPLIKPKQTEKKFPRSKMILVCGTSMNSGKSMAASACCWALSSSGLEVRASKVTGTASLKDILQMNDAGAVHYADFTYLGYPSTYLLSEEEQIDIFNKLDLRYANNPQRYWVVEFADGINQRETAYLLNHPEVKKRIHKFIFCAYDAFGAIGGLQVLKDRFKLVPDAISGVCSSSPLLLKELKNFSDIPVFNSFQRDLNTIKNILI